MAVTGKVFHFTPLCVHPLCSSIFRFAKSFNPFALHKMQIDLERCGLADVKAIRISLEKDDLLSNFTFFTFILNSLFLIPSRLYIPYHYYTPCITLFDSSKRAFSINEAADHLSSTSSPKQVGISTWRFKNFERGSRIFPSCLSCQDIIEKSQRSKSHNAISNSPAATSRSTVVVKKKKGEASGYRFY